MPSQVNTPPDSWKQEVNRRVAEHKNRKGPARVEPDELQVAPKAASSRAAQALARVNARYANAPSYNQILAGEARAVVRAAEAATHAAAEAQAAAESVLAGLEAVTAAEAEWQAEAVHSMQVTAQVLPELEETEPAEAQPGAFEVRWDDAFDERTQEPAASANTRSEIYEIVSEGWHEQPAANHERESEAVEIVEAGHPIPGNLIEFPRELVATRRVRPRLVEGPLTDAAELEVQLSIFEVDPATVSTQVEETPMAQQTPMDGWQTEEWPGIELPEETIEEQLARLKADAASAPALEPAPMGMRVMAAIVNVSLVTAATLVSVALTLSGAKALPGTHAALSATLGGLALAGLLYTLLFYVLGDGTPGMRYAHLRLATFSGKRTTRLERMGRLGGLLLSVLPLGLGLVWMLFDEEHLCWHDRLSRTYLRRY
jgi:uncharacterized RDD family membrane protein YckC